MPYWLSSSKVRMGLLVNGLYLLSLFMPSHSQVGGRPYVHTYERPLYEAAERPARRPPAVVNLPPATGPTKATSHRDERSGSLSVYLEKDLTLLEKEGNQLLLSPTFTVRPYSSPDSVLLHFVSYSGEYSLSTDNGLSITADGRRLWPAYAPDGDPTRDGWRDGLVPPSVTETEHGVVESVGRTIPYEVFVKAIDSKKVVISLGPHVSKLKAGQLEALRDMHRLWSDSRATVSRPKQF
jgi:hypothetical protein